MDQMTDEQLIRRLSDVELVGVLKANYGDTAELQELATRLFAMRKQMDADKRHAEMLRTFQQHKERLDRLENLMQRSKGMAEVRPRKTDDFTIAGCAVVLANALLFASEPLQQACVMLGNMELGTNSSILNGYLYVATLLLQSVLDSVAATCQKVHPVDGCGDVYFCSYSFFKSDVVWLSAHQRVIGVLKWKGSSFNQLANALKHEQAWVGCVSAPSELGVRDVYDEEGAGFVYSILVPVYKQAKCMVCRLASQLGQSAPRLPDM